VHYLAYNETNFNSNITHKSSPLVALLVRGGYTKICCIFFFTRNKAIKSLVGLKTKAL